VPEDITPIQVIEKSNMFIWSQSQIGNRTGEKDASGVEPLAAVQLSRVCKQLYEEVALTHLFYRVNHFNFDSEFPWDDNAISYLVAITENRMKAIRSVSCTWRTWGCKSNMTHLFALLGACDGLQVFLYSKLVVT
jgi:hypothetical protein